MFNDTRKKITEYAKVSESPLLMAVVFCLPLLPKVTTICIILWALAVLICYERSYFFNFLKNKDLVLYAIIYLLLIIGVSYTLDIESGILKIQTQASLILFPILLGGTKISHKGRDRYLNCFVLGTVLTVLVCLVYSTYRSVDLGQPYIIDAFGRKKSVFFYQEFSQILDLHPSYLSMYLGFSVFYLISAPLAHLGVLRNFRVFLILFLFLANFLTSSKAGILFLLLLLVAFFVRSVIAKENKKYLLIATVLVLVTILFFSIGTASSNRFSRAFSILDEIVLKSKDVNESTGIRFGLWKLSAEVGKQSFLIGHGTGSVAKILNERCLDFYVFSACENFRNKNSHNQYLNFLVSNGIIAVMLFLAALIYGLVKAIRDKNHLSLFFILFIMLNFLSESLLQRERGMVFFSLFVTLLAVSSRRSLKYED